MPYDVQDGQIVTQDHVSLGPIELLETQRERSLGLDYVWFPSGEIYWFPTDLRTGTHDNVRHAVGFLNSHTPLRIHERSSETMSDMLEIKGNNSPHYGGYVANYWNENDSNKVMRLSQKDNDDATRGTILHEFGHVLGFPHEFQRPDRDSFVDISNCSFSVSYAWNAGRMGTWPNWGNEAYSLLGPFDEQSMMQYSCVDDLNGNNLENPRFHDGNGWRTQVLSRGDINAIYRTYARPLGTVGRPA